MSRGRSLVGVGAAGLCRDLVQLISEGRRCPGPCGCSDPAGNWDIESRNCLQTRETTNRDLPPPHNQSPPNLIRVWLERRFWCGPGSGQTTGADRGTAGYKQAPGGEGQWGTSTKVRRETVHLGGAAGTVCPDAEGRVFLFFPGIHYNSVKCFLHKEFIESGRGEEQTR